MRQFCQRIFTRLRVVAACAVGASLVLAGPSPADQALQLADAAKVYADPSSVPGKTVFSAEDELFLDDLQRRGIQFFIDEADPVTGLMPDRALAGGGAVNNVSSTASVGFGITALCIGVERGWIDRDDAYQRCLKVLKFLRDEVEHHHGYFYHFMDMRTGKRAWNCEVSNIDTALLMAGVITVRQYFPDTELAKVANDLYERVDWPWMMRPDGAMHTGFKPERGMYEGVWAGYSECPVGVALMGLGSKTHPFPEKTWHTWERQKVMTYAGLTFVQCPPLFTHQFPQCWFDLRGLQDGTMDYFKNAQLATIAQRQWTIDELSKKHPHLGENMWGITASDFKGGYTAWGGPPADGPVDGTVVPCAPAGSLAFAPRICIDALKEMKARVGEKGYRKYGFVDSFDLSDDWYNKDVIGIDVGPTVLAAENARSGFVWKTFMSAPEAKAALKKAGFRPVDPNAPATTSIYGR